VTDYLRPASLDDALAARRDHPDWTVLAGGTDLLVSAPQRPAPVGVIDLFGLGPLVGIRASADGGLVIGAATTHAALVASPECRTVAPALVAAASEVGALQIQARGTLGGNIATSSPVGDTLPVLLALDATIEVASLRGHRQIPYRDFCTGYRRTALAADELLVAIHLPPPAPGARQFWRKVGTRRAQSISKVMAAAVIRLDGSGVVTVARIGLGAVADRPIRAVAAERVLTGRPLRADAAEAAEAVRVALAGELKPIDDVRSTADYRLAVAQNVIARFVLQAAEDRSPPSPP
jgi:xanthine dehydrogenase small subunit